MGQTVKIGSKEYGKAFDEGHLPSVAVYVALCKIHSGKNFYFKTGEKTRTLTKLAGKVGISYHSLKKHIDKLEYLGLADIYTNEIRLRSLKKTQKGVCKYVYVPENINTYKEIKEFLKTIPFLSNIKAQVKAIEKKKRLIEIEDELKRENGKLTIKEYKKLKRFKDKGGILEVNNQIMCSIKRIGEILDFKSRHTVVKYKKLLKKFGSLDYFNTRSCIVNNIDRRTYFRMKEYGLIPKYAYYYNRNVYVYNPTVFVPLKISSICI